MNRTFEQILEEDYHVQLEDNRRDESMKLAAEKYASQQQQQGEGWVKEKPKNDKEFVMITSSWYNDTWNYSAWEIIKLPGEDYFYLCELDGEEWGDYEDLSAQLYKVLSPPPKQ